MSTDSTPNAARPNELLPANTDHPLVIACQLGRLLKRLHFVACEHCLGLRRASEVEDVLVRLRSMGRQAVAADLRGSIQEVIEAKLDAFWQTIETEWWSELRCERNEHLCHSRGDVAGVCIELVCREVLYPTDTLFSELGAEIGRYLDQWGRTAMNLGTALEVGQCYWDILNSLPAPSAEASPIDRNLFTSDARESTTARFVLASNCQFYSVRLRSLNSWLGELQQLWRELSFSDGSFPRWETIVDPSTTPEQLGRSQLERFIAQVDTAFRSIVVSHFGIATDPCPRPVIGYLGLSADDSTRTISRDGAQHTVENVTALKLEIFRLLLQNRGRYTSRTTLRELVWATAGREARAGDGTIDNEISELRRLLRPLRIDIKNSKRIGWRLEEIAEEQAENSPDVG